MLGRLCDLPPGIEQDIVNYIFDPSRFYGLTRSSLMLSSACEIAEKNNVKTRFNKENDDAMQGHASIFILACLELLFCLNFR